MYKPFIVKMVRPDGTVRQHLNFHAKDKWQAISKAKEFVKRKYGVDSTYTFEAFETIPDEPISESERQFIKSNFW